MEGWKRLKSAPPGRRFEDHYRRSHRGGPRKYVMIGLGVLLIAGGVFLGLVPGIPGFVLAIAGAALISNESRRVARALDRVEVWLRKRF